MESRAADIVFAGGLLVGLSWIAIWMWQSVKPPRVLFLLAAGPAVLATTLVGLFGIAVEPTENQRIVAMFVCVAALVVPCTIMVRHQLVRVIRAVFPSARLVRRRRR